MQLHAVSDIVKIQLGVNPLKLMKKTIFVKYLTVGIPC